MRRPASRGGGVHGASVRRERLGVRLRSTSLSLTTFFALVFGIGLSGNAGAQTCGAPLTGLCAVTTQGARSNGIDAATDAALCVQLGAGACNVGITAAAVNTAGAGAAGIMAATNDALTINAGTVGTTGANAPGVVAAAGAGAVNLALGSVTATGAGSPAVMATGMGAINIVLGQNGAGGATSAQGTAVMANTTGAVSVTVLPGATVMGLTGGIVATGGAGVTINNSGTIAAGNGAPIVTTGLTNINNAGVISEVNGHVGDTLTVSGTLNGQPGSVIALDANLGLNTGTTTDRVVAGTLTGTTTITLTNLGPAGAGVLNPGTTVVTAGGGAGVVVLGGPNATNGTVSSGFIDFTIRPGPGGTFQLVGLPSQAAYESVRAGLMTQNLWYASADAWSSRVASAGAADESTPRRKDTELWGTAYGSSKRDYNSRESFTALGFTSERDLSFKQDQEGAQFGADTLKTKNGGRYLLGVTAGYESSDARFKQTGNRAKLEGFNIGAYFSWLKGRFFGNALAKADFNHTKLDIDTVATTARFDSRNYGGEVEAGYHLGTSALSLTPKGSLAYIRGDLDDYSAAASTIRFADAESLRGKLGAEISASRTTGYTHWQPFFGLDAVHEFKGDNRATFSNGGFDIPLSDRAYGTYGLASVGVNALSLRSNVHSYIKGEYAFGDVKGFGGMAGISIRF